MGEFLVEDGVALGAQDVLYDVAEGAGFFEGDKVLDEGLKNFAEDAVDVFRGGEFGGGFGEFLKYGFFGGEGLGFVGEADGGMRGADGLRAAASCGGEVGAARGDGGSRLRSLWCFRIQRSLHGDSSLAF